MSENAPIAGQTVETYAEMFAAYLEDADWIGVAEKPLVFHVRKLCQQLDNALARGTETTAAKDSAYLQAIERLNKRRPASSGAGGVERDPAQTDVFDFID